MHDVTWYPMDQMPLEHLVLVRFKPRQSEPNYSGPNMWCCWRGQRYSHQPEALWGDHHSSAFGTEKDMSEALEWTFLPE